MQSVLWRVRPLAPPVWREPCRRCAAPFLESTARFRVNANGALHDVWLIYACPACGGRRKHRLHRRVSASALGPALAGYRRDDPLLAESAAFELANGESVPYAVARPPLPARGGVEARIEQPLACGVRWDRFLVGELGWDRGAVRAAWRAGRIRVQPDARPNRPVRDAQRLRLELGGDAPPRASLPP